MMIRITAKQEGFRRAGLAHSASPTNYLDDQFTEEQLIALTSEPMLIVEYIKDSNEDMQSDSDVTQPPADTEAPAKPTKAAKATAAEAEPTTATATAVTKEATQ